MIEVYEICTISIICINGITLVLRVTDQQLGNKTGKTQVKYTNAHSQKNLVEAL